MPILGRRKCGEMATTLNPYGLPDRQWAFVQEYLIDLNATQAYVRAGYTCTLKAAEANAIRLLRKDKVVAALQAEKAKRAERVHLCQDAVLEEIYLLSHSDITNYTIDPQGNVVLVPGVHKRAMRAVASLQKKITPTEHGPQYETRIWLWNKPASVKMAGDHLGIFDSEALQSHDIQTAQAERSAAVAQAKAQLQAIRERHAQAQKVVPS